MTALAPGRPPQDVSTVRLLGRACAAEWVRARTVRSTWLFLAAGALLMLGIAAAAGTDAATDPSAAGDAAWVAAEFTMLPGQFAFLALALTMVTADYATGGIVTTLQWTTRRTLVFVSRALVAVALATTAAVLLALGAVLTALLASRSALELPLDGAEVLGSVAVVVAGGSALAVGLGFVLRSTAGGIATVFLLMLVLPVMLPNLPLEWGDDVGRRLPGTGAVYLLMGQVDGMTTASSLGVLLTWAGAALLLGWVRLVRSDANR